MKEKRIKIKESVSLSFDFLGDHLAASTNKLDRSSTG